MLVKNAVGHVFAACQCVDDEFPQALEPLLLVDSDFR